MPRHVVVAPFSAAEVYVSSSPAAIVGIGTLVSSPYTAIPLANSHRFIRNSVNYRVFIVDNPVRYCTSGQNLVRYSNYGFLTTALTDSDPGGSADIVSHDVSASSGNNSFVLSAGSEDMNTTMLVNLAFSKANISIDLNHQVLIRNVP
jgi:MSHA biogenesis protein MshO